MRALLSFAGRHGPVVLFVGVFLGLLLPGLAAAARPLMGAAVFVFTLGSFLKVGSLDLRELLARPGRLLAVLGWVGVGVPLATCGLLGLLPLPADIKTGMMLCMLAPPVGSAAAIAAMLRLDAALALLCTVVISLLSPLLLPPAALALGAVDLHIDAQALGVRLLALTLGAAAVSTLLRRCAGDFMRNSGEAMTGLSVVGLLVVAVGAMHGMRSPLLLHGQAVAGVLGLAFGLNVAFQLLGAALFVRLGGRAALTVGLVSGNRNVTLGWVAAMPWLQDAPAVELFLAASVFPIFMLPLPLSRLIAGWQRRRSRDALRRVCPLDLMEGGPR